MKRRRQCWRIHRYANPRVMVDLAQFACLVEGVSKVMAYTKLVMVLFLSAAVTCEAQTVPLLQIRQNGAVKQFFVDDKPFIMKFVRVRTQSEYEAKIITPEQCFRILMAMPQLERTLTLLIAATGLRISECLGLQWADVDYDSQQVFVRRSWTGGKVGKSKSAASKAPVPLVPLLAGFIRQWQEQTPYGQPTDWVFASTRLKGKQPRVANMSEDRLAAQDEMLAAMMTKSNAVN